MKFLSAYSNPNVLRELLAVLFVCGSAMIGPAAKAVETPRVAAKDFFARYCTDCHGPKKSKGHVTLHELGDDLSGARDPELLDKLLDVLESHDMPPEDEDQPSNAEREAVLKWVDDGLRAENAKAGKAPQATPTARRLTNFEYENTMADLLGFRLKLAENLPEDPVKPYHFNNTAEFMRIGPEQLDLYLEAARRAMASAIVDPEKPQVHTSRQEWKPLGVDRGLGNDEVPVWGNSRFSPGAGMGLKSFPATGEYRIRMKASAILPPGVQEIPLRLVMGYDLNVNGSTQRIEPVGTVRLKNSPDQPQVFEFRGRIENYPVKPGIIGTGKPVPESLTITPQNLYNDGTLNDENVFSRERNASMPRAVVEWIEFESPITETWPPEHHRRILFDSPLRTSQPEDYVREVLKRFMSRAYRRPATEEEIGRFAGIYKLILPDLGTMEAAMRETLSMVLISPQFLYHTVAEEGKVPRQYELASKLSYFLWGSMPDDELLKLATAGTLENPDVIGAQVRRLLDDRRSRDFVTNFTMQWLSLSKMKTVPINRDLFPRFLYYVPLGERAGTEEPYRPTIRDFMIDETVSFVAELIKRNASVLQIVDSDFACLNQTLAAHYGVQGVQGDEVRPVPIKPEQRLGGLLTQGSVLIGNGTGSAPHPIYRAVWLREAILGDEVAPPPAEVPALSDSAGASAEKALTIKDLLVKHRKVESCNDCHSRLDPWGIPFEQYNAIGRYQPMVPMAGTQVGIFSREKHVNLAGYEEYLKTINKVRIDSDSRLPNGTAVTGMEDLKAYLIRDRKQAITSNVLKRLLSYGLGRELNPRDHAIVEDLLTKSEKQGNGWRDMIVAVCQSQIFRNETRN